MPTTFEIQIQPAANQTGYQITWHHPATNQQDHFVQTGHFPTPDEITRLWLEPKHQLEIGQKLFRFLDGDARHFARALDAATQQAEILTLHLRACSEVADWPFELLARDHRFLLPAGVNLVRRVSDWGAVYDICLEFIISFDFQIVLIQI